MLKGLLVVIGMAVGGAIASGVFLWLMHKQEQQHAAEIAVLAGNRRAGPDESAPKRNENKYTPEEKKIVELCLDLVKDFEKNRLSSIYRNTTAAYQNKTERKIFDERFAIYQRTLQRLLPAESERDYKLTKLSGDKGYDFYFTGKERGDFNGGASVVNITFTMVQEQAEWRIDEVEITTAQR